MATPTVPRSASAIDGIQIDDARPLVTYDDDGAAILTVDVPTDVVNSVEERLKFETPGLYPVRTELLAGIGSGDILVATHGTVVQRLPGPNESAPVPIDLSIVTAVKPAADGDTAAAAEFADAVAFAGAVTAPVTLDVPPPIVAAAASTPAGSQSLAGALVGDEFVAVPAVPFDVSSAVEVDRGDEFARLLSAGEDMLTAAVPTTPSRRNAWVVLDPLSGAGAQELRDLGYRYLVMTQDMYRATVDTDPQDPGSQDTGLPPTDLFTTVSLPDGGTLPLIVVDSLSADLTVASADEILASSTPAEWAVGAVTSMLVDDLEQPALEHSRVLSTPDLAAPDARLVTGLEALAATTPSVEFVEASTLTGTTDFQTARGEPVVVTLPDTAGPSLAARVELLNATALSAASAGSMLPPDDPRPDRWATTLNAMLSTAIDDDQAAVVAGQVQAEADAFRDAVVPPDAVQVHPHRPLGRHRGPGRQHVGRTARRRPALLVAEAVVPRVDATAGRSRGHRRRRRQRHTAPERRDLIRHPGAGQVERHLPHHGRGADPRRRVDRRSGHDHIPCLGVHRPRTGAHRRVPPRVAQLVVRPLAEPAARRHRERARPPSERRRLTRDRATGPEVRTVGQ